MAKRILFTDQAKADIGDIEQPIALQRLKTVTRFLASDEGNVKRLQGVEPPLYRLRTQDHRVIFPDPGDAIEIVRVRARRDAHR